MTDNNEREVKRFLVFGYDAYYPWGGLDDIIGDTNSIEEAVEKINKGDFRKCGYYEILDLVTLTGYDVVTGGIKEKEITCLN